MWMVEVGNKKERTCSDVDGGSGQKGREDMLTCGWWKWAIMKR